MPFAELNAALLQLDRYVSSREPRFIATALRALLPIRTKGKASPAHAVASLSLAGATYIGASAPLKAHFNELLASLPQPTADVTAAAAAAPEPAEGEKASVVEKKPAPKLPECEIFVALLLQMLLIDCGKATSAMPWSLLLMERVAALKRRTLDPLSEKVYFYASWAFESCGQLAAIRSRRRAKSVSAQCSLSETKVTWPLRSRLR